MAIREDESFATMTMPRANTLRSPGSDAGGGGAPTGGGGGGEIGGASLRVILVGKLPLEQTLRREAGVRLVRARTALEAVGELAEDMTETGAQRSVVLVGAEAEPIDPTETSPPGTRGTLLESFISALREIDPGVLVLRVADNRLSPGPSDGAYDAIVPSDASAGLLRTLVEAKLAPRGRPSADQSAAPMASADLTRAIVGEATPTDGAPAPTEAPIGGASTSVITDPAMGPAMGSAGDSQLVAAVMSGRDVLLPALGMIRRRLLNAGISYLQTGGTNQPAGTRTAEVRYRTRVFGSLVDSSGQVSESGLIAAADWLGHWLALQEQQSELRRGALVDDLTGAFNRRYFERFMKAAIEECRKNKHSLSVLLLDVDNFKFFNDRFGHAAGDEILQEVVRLLRSCIRGNDRVCRLGGDEIAVVFYEPAGQREPGSRPMTDVMPVAMRFQQQIKEHRFPKLGTAAPGPLSVSGGIATYPWDGATTAELLARADEFLLQSKREGKNRITIGHHPQH